MPSDEFDQIWTDGLHLIAPESAAPEHERVMRRVARRRRRRVAGSTGLTAMACLMAIGLASLTDGANSITTTTTDSSVEKPTTTTALDPTSTTTTIAAPLPVGGNSGPGMPSAPRDGSGDSGDGATAPATPAAPAPPSHPNSPTTTAAPSPAPGNGVTPTTPTTTPTPPTPATTTTTISPDWDRRFPIIRVVLGADGIVVTPSTFPAGWYRVQFLEVDGVHNYRSFLHLDMYGSDHGPYDPPYHHVAKGTMTQPDLYCPGPYTLRVTEGSETGPDVTPAITLHITGEAGPGCDPWGDWYG